MRIIYGVLFSFFLTVPAFADISIDPLIHRITFQLNAEQWVPTKTALVSVGINASVSDVALEKIQSDVISKLNSITKSDWHVISFERTQDKSGLERVQISAQARIAEGDLSGLRDKAKSISKPGETFTIDNIQFTPSEDEIREATNNLRNQIYQQTKAELDRLNKMYPDQKYYVHDINFLSTDTPMPMARNMMLAKVGDNMASSPSGLSVGDKLRINAEVVLAAGPDPVLLKETH